MTLYYMRMKIKSVSFKTRISLHRFFYRKLIPRMLQSMDEEIIHACVSKLKLNITFQNINANIV